MKDRSKHKLVLSRETLRQLEDGEQVRVVGGEAMMLDELADSRRTNYSCDCTWWSDCSWFCSILWCR
jgi:hypothetical protein